MTQNVKKSAEITVNNVKYRISQFDDKKIEIKPVSRREAMREFSKIVGLDYDDEWNTQYFGHKLIDFLNNETPKSVSDKASATPSATLGKNIIDLSTDPDAAWYLNSSDFTKWMVLWLGDEDYNPPKFSEENGFKITSSEFDVSDMGANGCALYMRLKRTLKNPWADGLRELDISDAIRHHDIKHFTDYDYSELAERFSLGFYYSPETTEFPTHLGNLKLKRLGIYSDFVVPDDLEGFDELEHFRFDAWSKTALSTFPLCFSKLKNLKKLELPNINIVHIPDNLSGFESLEELTLYGDDCKISLEDALKLTVLPKLETLTLPESLEEHEEELQKAFPNVDLSFS